MNATKVKVMRKTKRSVIYRAMDEHSMNMWVSWTWIEHLYKEYRRTHNVLDMEMNTVHCHNRRQLTTFSSICWPPEGCYPWEPCSAAFNWNESNQRPPPGKIRIC